MNHFVLTVQRVDSKVLHRFSLIILKGLYILYSISLFDNFLISFVGLCKSQIQFFHVFYTKISLLLHFQPLSYLFFCYQNGYFAFCWFQSSVLHFHIIIQITFQICMIIECPYGLIDYELSIKMFDADWLFLSVQRQVDLSTLNFSYYWWCIKVYWMARQRGCHSSQKNNFFFLAFLKIIRSTNSESYIIIIFKMPRVWLFMFFGYNGKDFNGMQHQKQTNVRTIQNLLIDRLYKADLLATNDYFELVKTYKWGRAARTDKGVHAVLNAISCLFTIPQKFYDEPKMLQKEKLVIALKQVFEDTEIIVHGIRKVTTRFDIRQMVKSRTYCYHCPLAYFTNYCEEQISEEQKTRIVQKINFCCSKFIGTHNFHNYTRGLKAKDPQSKRIVHRFECSLQENWIKFTIKGQSFIYHQIRKMIGILVQVFMNEYDPGFVDNTFFNNQIIIPLAPPHGLYLEKLHFDSYNRKNDIPEKIQFERQAAQLNKLQEQIIQYIHTLPSENWSSWFQETREGIAPKFEQTEPVLGADDC